MAVAPLASRWIERVLAGNDPPLTVAQYLALRAIARGDVSAAQLARRTGVTGPAVSQLLASLEASELIERAPAPGDRRRHEIALSSRGRRVFESAEALLGAQLATLLAEVPRPEADALARLLPRIEGLLSGVPPPRRPPKPHPRPPR